MTAARRAAVRGSARQERPAWLQPLAEALAEALPRLLAADEADAPARSSEERLLLREVISALTHALAQGRLTLPLAGEAPEGVTAAAWPGSHRSALERSSLCREPMGPLVLEGDALCWRLWHERRRGVIEALVARARQRPPAAGPAAAGPAPSRPGATGAAEAGDGRLDRRQREAVQAVLTHGLVLLQGGPGTGKTMTVARMLAAVQAAEPHSRIQLAAPTGKAAARLRQATGGRHPCSTLHRLLESRGDHFARNRLNPLALDLLVIDELSMVDLELMAAVLEALPDTARLVLVGDPAQLPPIAPGAVLEELQRPELEEALAGARVTLTTTYRNDGAIAAVAARLRHPLPEADPLTQLRPVLKRLSPEDNLAWLEAEPPSLPRPLLSRLEEHRVRLAERARSCSPQRPEGWAALLAERDRLLVLSPLRRGPWGVEGLHRALLGEALERGPLAWPPGTPVLCCRNRPDLGVANGDVGVLVVDGDTPQLLFGEGDAPLWLHPAQLAGVVEPAFALTVHRSQGSEAAEVIVLLAGDAHDPRLLYTALTRARQRALLITAAPGPAAPAADP